METFHFIIPNKVLLSKWKIIYSFNIFFGKYSININILCFLFRYIVRFVDGKQQQLLSKNLMQDSFYHLSCIYFIWNNQFINLSTLSNKLSYNKLVNVKFSYFFSNVINLFPCFSLLRLINSENSKYVTEEYQLQWFSCIKLDEYMINELLAYHSYIQQFSFSVIYHSYLQLFSFCVIYHGYLQLFSFFFIYHSYLQLFISLCQ
jgi:hypothetical protein